MGLPKLCRNRRGATITIVALSVAAMLAMGAISVDLGMLMKMHGDAQRTADAAALAGASAYLEPAVPDVRAVARDRAFKYAAQNYVGGTYVDTTGKVQVINGNNWIITAKEAKVEIAPSLYRVRVTISRPGARTLFARVLGIDSVMIRAFGTAEATDAGGAKCVKPFALADAWDEKSSDDNGNKFWDFDEEWDYDPSEDGDAYRPWDGNPVEEPGDPIETGYGSAFRNNNGQGYSRDYGRLITVKPQNPNGPQVITPGNFFAWDMPNDPTNTSTCGIGGGGGGATEFSKYICSCNNQQVFIDQPYPIKNGNMVEATAKGIEDLIELDDDAVWNPTGGPAGRGAVDGSKFANWLDSPRVIKVALYDPDKLYKSGKIDIEFNNIALFFVEKYDRIPGDQDDAVFARFLTFAEGAGSPGPGGPLTKVLRLVE